MSKPNKLQATHFRILFAMLWSVLFLVFEMYFKWIPNVNLTVLFHAVHCLEDWYMSKYMCD